jgi:transcriptional regulator with PAS, ATPase and Fis domain
MNEDARQPRDTENVSESRYAAVLETMVDAVITIDVRGMVLSGNSAVEVVFGYAPAELIGKNVSMLMPSAPITTNTSITIWNPAKRRSSASGAKRRACGPMAPNSRSTWPSQNQVSIPVECLPVSSGTLVSGKRPSGDPVS